MAARSPAGLFVAAVLGACLPAPPDWTGTGDVQVLVVGDSLTKQAQHGMSQGLQAPTMWLVSDQLKSHGYAESVSAFVGAVTADLAFVADNEPEPGADTLIIALGTNDLHVYEYGPVPVATSLANVDAAIAEIAPACVGTIGVADTPEWGLSESAAEYNAALASRADVYGDWAAVVSSHPEYLKAGDVHHTEAGSAAYRDLIVEVADACAARIGASTPEVTTP